MNQNNCHLGIAGEIDKLHRCGINHPIVVGVAYLDEVDERIDDYESELAVLANHDLNILKGDFPSSILRPPSWATICLKARQVFCKPVSGPLA
jgi:hypothetical protein